MAVEPTDAVACICPACGKPTDSEDRPQAPESWIGKPVKLWGDAPNHDRYLGERGLIVRTDSGYVWAGPRAS